MCSQINMRLERHAEVARQLAGEGRRDRALLALRKKKLSEKQLSQLHSLIINVEEMVGSKGAAGNERTICFRLMASSQLDPALDGWLLWTP